MNRWNPEWEDKFNKNVNYYERLKSTNLTLKTLEIQIQRLTHTWEMAKAALKEKHDIDIDKLVKKDEINKYPWE